MQFVVGCYIDYEDAKCGNLSNLGAANDQTSMHIRTVSSELSLISNIEYGTIGGFRKSQSDVIFAHAHIRGRQRFVKLYGTCVKCGFIF